MNGMRKLMEKYIQCDDCLGTGITDTLRACSECDGMGGWYEESISEETLNEDGTMPTIKSVQAWKVVDEMGESVLHTNLKEAIVDYAESYAEAKTESVFDRRNVDKKAWNKYFKEGKLRAQNIVAKGKK